MKKTHLPTRLLAMVLAFALLFGFAVPVGATGTGEAEITFRQVDNSAVSVDSKTELPVESPSQPDYADTPKTAPPCFTGPVFRYPSAP